MQPLANETVYSYVGDGAAGAASPARVGPEATDVQVQDALAFFSGLLQHHMIDHTVLYPGVRETLDRLLRPGSRWRC